MPIDFENIILKKIRKRRRRIIRLSIAFLLLYVNLEIVFLYYATPILKTAIKSLIYYESEALYSIDFEKISINLTTRSFELSNFTLKPDTALFQYFDEYGKTKRALYEIKLPGLSISRIGLYQLFMKNTLSIKKVKILQPELRLIGLPSAQKGSEEKYDAVHNDLYPAISRYLKALIIENIEIDDGYFDLYTNQRDKKQTTVVNHININLSGFKLDEQAFLKKNKLFYSQQIEIKIRDYSFLLSDKMHMLMAEEVTLSKNSNTILAKNIKLQPIDDSLLQSKNFYHVQFPAIKIYHANLEKGYFEHIIEVGKILLSSPQIKMLSKQNILSSRDTIVQASPDSLETALFRLIGGKLSSFSVDTFDLSGGSFYYYKSAMNSHPSYKIDSLSINLQRFFLDSKSGKNKNKILLADDIELFMKDFSMDLADQLHTLNARNLNISTLNKVISATSVSILPNINSRFLGNPKMNIHVPFILINNVDLHSAYNYKTLTIDNLLMGNPSVQIMRHSDLTIKSVEKTKTPSELYTYVRPYVNTLKINLLAIENGNFGLDYFVKNKRKGFVKGKVTFQLFHFLLDPVSVYKSDKFFYAREIELKLKDFSSKSISNPHIFSASSLDLSTIKNKISVDDIQFEPLKTDDTLALLKEYRTTSLFDLKVKNLEMDQVDAQEAYFKKNLTINSIKINRPGFSFIKYIGLEFKNDTIVKNDSTLTTENFKKNNKEKINIPDSIPSFSDSSYLNKEALGYKMKLMNMFVDYLGTISIRNLQLDSGNISVSNKDTTGNIHSSFSNQLSASLSNFYLDSDSVSLGKRFFFSDNINIKLKDPGFNMPDQVHILKASEIGLSTERSEIYASVLRIFPRNNRSDTLSVKNLFTVYFPLVRFSGVDFEKLINSKQLTIDSAKMDNAVIILNKPEDSTELKKSIRSKSASLPLWMNELQIKNITGAGANFSFNKIKGTKENNVIKTRLNFQVQDMNISNENKKKNSNLLRIDGLKAQFHDLVFTLADSIHQIKAGLIDVNKKDSTLLAKSVTIKYDINKNYIPLLKSTAKSSLYDISIPLIRGKGFCSDSLIFDKIVYFSSLKLDSPDVFVKVYLDFNPIPFRFNELDLYGKIKRSLNSFTSKKTDINNGKLKLTRIIKDTAEHYSFRKISGSMMNFELDKRSEKKPVKLLNSDDLSLSFKDYKIPLKDTIYNLEIREIGLSTKKSQIYANDFSIKPVYEKYELSKILGYQKTALFIDGKRLELNNINIPSLVEEKKLIAKSINLKKVGIHAFLDKQFPEDIEKTRILPPEYIKNIKHDIIIDTINLSDSYIGYEELAEKTKVPATLSAEKINAQLVNISNDSVVLRKNDITKLNISCYAMGKSKVDAYLVFPLNSPNQEHTFVGNLDTINMAYFNPFLENIALLSIKGGIIDNLKFQINANDQVAEGKMAIRYNDLKLTVLNKSENDSLTTKKGFKSLLANTIIPKDNPRNPNGRVNEGLIYSQRVPTKTVITYWSQALLSGVKSTLGFDSKEQKDYKKLNKRIARLTNKEERAKVNRINKLNKELEKDIKKQEKQTRKTPKT